MKIPRWSVGQLESSLPHIIVDSTGRRRAPHPDFPPFKNRGTATRLLNRLRRKPSPFIVDDPKTWQVQVVKPL